MKLGTLFSLIVLLETACGGSPDEMTSPGTGGTGTGGSVGGTAGDTGTGGTGGTAAGTGGTAVGTGGTGGTAVGTGGTGGTAAGTGGTGGTAAGTGGTGGTAAGTGGTAGTGGMGGAGSSSGTGGDTGTGGNSGTGGTGGAPITCPDPTLGDGFECKSKEARYAMRDVFVYAKFYQTSTSPPVDVYAYINSLQTIMPIDASVYCQDKKQTAFVTVWRIGQLVTGSWEVVSGAGYLSMIRFARTDTDFDTNDDFRVPPPPETAAKEISLVTDTLIEQTNAIGTRNVTCSPIPQ